MPVDLLHGSLFSNFAIQLYLCYLIYLERRTPLMITMFLLTGPLLTVPLK